MVDHFEWPDMLVAEEKIVPENKTKVSVFFADVNGEASLKKKLLRCGQTSATVRTTGCVLIEAGHEKINDRAIPANHAWAGVVFAFLLHYTHGTACTHPLRSSYYCS